MEIFHKCNLSIKYLIKFYNLIVIIFFISLMSDLMSKDNSRILVKIIFIKSLKAFLVDYCTSFSNKWNHREFLYTLDDSGEAITNELHEYEFIGI